MSNAGKLLSIGIVCFISMSGLMLMKKGLTHVGGFDIRHAVSSGLKLIFNPHMLLAASLLMVAFVLYLSILSKNQLSFLYPVVVGINFILLTTGASLFLNEPFSLPKIFGLILILAGITCLFLTNRVA